MNLNYLAFFLISFLPILIAYLWYHPNSWVLKQFNLQEQYSFTNMKWQQGIIAFIMSGSLVYGYMNLIIHQLGFYELFFTDIMLGKEESELVVEEFLGKYGQKHRHFGHGVLHGAINAFLFALPLILFNAFMEQKERRTIGLHFSYWLITSMVVGGLIAEFV